jgi:hypothetical protein
MNAFIRQTYPVRIDQPKLAKMVATMLFLFLLSADCFGQTGSVMQAFDPNNPFGIDQSAPQAQTLQQARMQEQARIQQQNLENMQRMGMQLPPTQEEIAKAAYYENLRILRERKKGEVYSEINSPEASLSSSVKNDKLSEIRKKLHLVNPASSEYRSDSKVFFEAKKELSGMLAGTSSIDLKRAVFLIENAYYKSTLGYQKYLAQIDNLVFICQRILEQNGEVITDKLACNKAIQRLYTDTISYKDQTGKPSQFLPFRYDFDDAWGNSDFSKMCVTKLLKTGTGQCRTLPLLYLILAAELKAPAYLAFGPNHSYIIYPEKNRYANFETTSGTYTTDHDIIASGYILPFAVKNGIYMTPANSKQVIAQCLNDLSEAYRTRFGYDENVINWNAEALQYFPNCINAMLTTTNVHLAYCFNLAEKYHHPAARDFSKYPDLKKQFDLVTSMDTDLERLGYVKIPKEQYDKWLEQMAEEKLKRERR